MDARRLPTKPALVWRGLLRQTISWWVKETPQAGSLLRLLSQALTSMSQSGKLVPIIDPCGAA